jgi:hypothetical protein
MKDQSFSFRFTLLSARKRPALWATDLVALSMYGNKYSPQWTIFGAPRKLGVSDWVQVPIE